MTLQEKEVREILELQRRYWSRRRVFCKAV
jgi:hypothetical protein